MKLSIPILFLTFTLIAAPFTRFHFQWNPSPSPEVTHYHLYQGSDSNHITNLIVSVTDTNAYYKVASGTIYYYCVTALDSNETESLPSNILCVTNP